MGKFRRLIAAAAVFGAVVILPVSSIASRDAAVGHDDSSVSYSAKRATTNGGQGEWPLKV